MSPQSKTRALIILFRTILLIAIITVIVFAGRNSSKILARNGSLIGPQTAGLFGGFKYKAYGNSALSYQLSCEEFAAADMPVGDTVISKSVPKNQIFADSQELADEMALAFLKSQVTDELTCYNSDQEYIATCEPPTVGEYTVVVPAYSFSGKLYDAGYATLLNPAGTMVNSICVSPNCRARAAAKIAALKELKCELPDTSGYVPAADGSI
ncbi:MAG: hypothetical protein WC250_01195 [Candidatus Paceibacterota bacterium]|jgi:hypothetical protein